MGELQTEWEKMVASFDRLVYMVKTTAPHLQALTDELRAKIKAAIAEALNDYAKTQQASSKMAVAPPPEPPPPPPADPVPVVTPEPPAAEPAPAPVPETPTPAPESVMSPGT